MLQKIVAETKILNFHSSKVYGKLWLNALLNIVAQTMHSFDFDGT